MTSAYYDSTYLFKLQCQENGAEAVRAHASTFRSIHTSVHARPEFISVCHRKLREGQGTHDQFQAVLRQFQFDCKSGGTVLLPLTDRIYDRVDSIFLKAPTSIYLRAADALHLACAAENGFQTVYSNDKHFLAAAPLFGLRGLNIIPAP